MQEKGLIHIYYGDGKGKTTAAVGQAVRAAGCGYRVLFVQFLKDDSSGERRILEKIPNIDCYPGRKIEKFSFQMTEEEKKETRRYCRRILKEVAKTFADYDVVILDEAVCAAGIGFLEEEDMQQLLKEKPWHTELVLTGHSPSRELLSMADYVTEMKKIRHPYEKGIPARNGIER